MSLATHDQSLWNAVVLLQEGLRLPGCDHQLFVMLLFLVKTIPNNVYTSSAENI